jgi:hypothetical protein
MLSSISRIFRQPARVLAGLALIVLPGTLTLLAADEKPRPAITPPAQVATTKPAATKPDPAKRKEEEIARVMEFFRVTQPDVYEQAKTLRETDHDKFEKLVHSAIWTVNKLEDMRKRNPRLFDLTMKDLELNYRSMRISRQLKNADLPSADRDKLTSELTGIVSSQFDLRQQIRKEEIENLKTQLKDLGDKLQKNEQVKDRLIKKRVDDLVEKPPRLDW